MIVVFYGTGAELIKMYGIIKGIPRKDSLLICTAQQYAGLRKLHKQLDIYPDIYLAKGWHKKDVANMKQMLGLMLRAHGEFAKQFRSIKRILREHKAATGKKNIAIVHGDTLTTLVGAYLAKFLNLPLAHVEAGLRSGSWKSPFPEELDRRMATKIARYHFAPNKLAEENLLKEHAKGAIVNTHYNTAKDAIEQSDKFISTAYTDLRLPKNYCLVLLHRTELLENREDLEAILRIIHDYADDGHEVVFTMHTTTRERIESHRLSSLLDHKNIHIIDKQPYFDFMAIVKHADCVITDGGGLQEDSYFLGVPVVIHRARTERQEGIGFNATLSKMDTAIVKDFLYNHPKKSELKSLQDNTSPSNVVVSYLRKNNYIN